MSDHRVMRSLYRGILSAQGIFGLFMRMRLCNDVRNCLFFYVLRFKEEMNGMGYKGRRNERGRAI